MIPLDRTIFHAALLAFSFSSISLLPLSPALAVDNTIDIVPDEQVDSSVELTPGFIGGTIDLGGQNISRVDLAARGGDFAANRYPASEGPYTLTVNVPTGESLDYTVSATAWMDNYTTRMFFQDQVVSVEEGQTSQLDYRVNSGYIAAELLTNGCTIVHSEMWATREDPGGYSKAMTKRGGEQQYRFPVQPNSAIRVYGQVQLSTGATFQLEEQAVTVSPGQETPVSWEVNCVAGQLSQIQHDVEYHLPMDYHLSYLYRQGSGSPYRVEKHEGSVLFADLAPGDWHLYSYSYWNNHQNLISKRFNNIKTLSGETTGVSFDQYPGFLRGSLALSGTHTIEDTSYAHIYAYGRNPLYPSDQVYSRALANNVDGTFNLALPQGEYSTYVSVYAFYRPTAGDDYLNASLYMYDYSKRNDLLYIDSQEVIEGYDVAYETGSAVIKFRRADGGAFSAPYITAKSYTYDENQVLQSYSYTTSRTLSAADRVTMVGFPGTYEVEAWAYVDGSRTIFGKVEVEIISGVEKVIDLGGPTLTVSEPAAGAVLSEQTLTLSGTATDESGIEAILVNGEAVAFSATDNPEDPYEVSFTTVITLGEGENKITTVASDASGNESTDSRTVTYVPPVAEVVQARMDIKPGSCKNPFNVTEKGVMPVVLLGSAEFDVREIDPASLTLHGVGLLRHAYGDAAEYLADGGCGTDQADGYEDLVLKFKSQAIVAALGAVSDGEVITLELNGTSYEGLELVADDHLTIIKRGRKK